MTFPTNTGVRVAVATVLLSAELPPGAFVAGTLTIHGLTPGWVAAHLPVLRTQLGGPTRDADRSEFGDELARLVLVSDADALAGGAL